MSAKFKLFNPAYLSILLSLLFVSTTGYAQSLKSILQYALVNDPILKEAQAEKESAENRTNQAKALHFPVISVTGNQPLASHHKNNHERNSKKFEPGVKGELNIFAFGAIDAEIKRNQADETYFSFKYDENREQVGYDIANLYLSALQSKNAIEILKTSLKRHNRILKDIETIALNDKGRESEFVQAEARKLMVEQQINHEQRNLENMLSRLSSYSLHPITPQDLLDPFSNLNEQILTQQYTLQSKADNPTYRAQQANLESKKADIDAEKRKLYPRLNLVGTATRHDREVNLTMDWNLFNRPSSYSVREKASQMSVASERLAQVSRNIDESYRLAKINMQQSQVALATLKKQVVASKKVVEFYHLQFQIARKTLIELLNAENELLSVELSRNSTETTLRQAILEYLHSQGMITQWTGITLKTQDYAK